MDRDKQAIEDKPEIYTAPALSNASAEANGVKVPNHVLRQLKDRVPNFEKLSPETLRRIIRAAAVDGSVFDDPKALGLVGINTADISDMLHETVDEREAAGLTSRPDGERGTSEPGGDAPEHVRRILEKGPRRKAGSFAAAVEESRGQESRDNGLPGD